MVEVFTVPDTHIHAATVELSADFAGRACSCDPIPHESLAKQLMSRLRGQVLVPGQAFLGDYKGINLLLRVNQISVFKESIPESVILSPEEIQQKGASNRLMSGAMMGMLGYNSKFIVTAGKGSTVTMASSGGTSASGSMTGSRLFRPDFALEEMGIGGLDKQVSSMFRRAFASRVYPTAVLSQMGLKHVRGVLLYGPPGCGKTLIARKIAKMLCDREPKIVNGPEVLSKFVGQSEENIRNLFADAKAEQEEKGDDSGLHVIIFDEMDAICKKRGRSTGDAGVGDSMVNQLLSYIDGVDSLNNVLVVGMTNRKDMLDEALLRPGRLEVHVEIGLPDYHGRVQISRIHTAGMLAGGHLDGDVKPEKLAEITENYSGAEIEGVCRAAASFAFDRSIKIAGGHLSPEDASKVSITWADFEQALTEIKPSLGADEESLSMAYERGLFNYGPRFEELSNKVNLFVKQVREGNGGRCHSVLLAGPPSTGKTALAAHVACHSELPYIKIVSPESMVNLDDEEKRMAILETFEGAYKSEHAVIVLDGIEKMIGWSRLGPRFSNEIAQLISILANKEPPGCRRLLILATTSNLNAIEELELDQAFDTVLSVEALDKSEVQTVLQESEAFNPSELEECCKLVPVPIGVKRLLTVLDLARDTAGLANTFSFHKALESCNLA